jgi:hypothetical protein
MATLHRIIRATGWTWEYWGRTVDAEMRLLEQPDDSE